MLSHQRALGVVLLEQIKLAYTPKRCLDQGIPHVWTARTLTLIEAYATKIESMAIKLSTHWEGYLQQLVAAQPGGVAEVETVAWAFARKLVSHVCVAEMSACEDLVTALIHACDGPVPAAVHGQLHGNSLDQYPVKERCYHAAVVTRLASRGDAHALPDIPGIPSRPPH
jgi:hypothetical protein